MIRITRFETSKGGSSRGLQKHLGAETQQTNYTWDVERGAAARKETCLYEHAVFKMLSAIFVGAAPLQESCRGFLLYRSWRTLSGIFLEEFSAHFFPPKMRRKNTATKSGGPPKNPRKILSAENRPLYLSHFEVKKRRQHHKRRNIMHVILMKGHNK